MRLKVCWNSKETGSLLRSRGRLAAAGGGGDAAAAAAGVCASDDDAVAAAGAARRSAVAKSKLFVLCGWKK